jgi:ABC-type transport system involved in cytochrome bd biosynthesis fused ATPase/permease subunit
MQEASREVELVASSDPHMLPAVARQLDAALTDLSAQNPILARKVAKMVKKVEQPATTEAVNSSQEAITKNESAARKMLAKAEKKFDIMKAKSANAAQANTALIGLGALLSVVGLVLLLATSGTGATVGLIALIIGVVLLILGLLSGR